MGWRPAPTWESWATWYEMFSVDLENDGDPDVGVISDPFDLSGTLDLRVRHFRNDGAGNFTEV